jgi:hypothetical protein
MKCWSLDLPKREAANGAINWVTQMALFGSQEHS